MTTDWTWDGTRLRELRLARGLTQPDLADIIGTTYQYISSLEREVRAPRADTLVRLAQALDVTPDTLLGVG